MSTQHSMFKTPEGQARYLAAYDATLALWPVPVESVDVPTRFGTTHVNACGPADAPPLVLLPAFAMSSTMWYPNAAGLSRAYRVYALDAIGDKGKSVSTRPILTPLDFVTWLSDVFDELRLEQAHVAGLSFGGFLALNLALSAPERVTKLVLLAPAACLLPIRPQFYFRLAAAILLPFLSLKFKQELSLGLASTHAAPALKQFLTPTDFRFDYNKVFIPPVYTDDALRQIKAPTLLLLGEREVIYDPKAALNRAANLMPHIETRLIPRADHALNCDQPELVNRFILEFLNCIEAHNPRLNAVVYKMYDQARTAAKGDLPDGPFKGVPFSLKDIIVSCAGVPTSGGNHLLQHLPMPRDSEVVVRQRLGLRTSY